MTRPSFLEASRQEFRRYRRLAEEAIAQIDPADYDRRPDDQANSIRVLMQHLAGNMRSRWTRVFEEDGEKPDRNRDGEFEPNGRSLEALRADWDAAWDLLLDFLGSLSDADMVRTVHIRGEPHSLAEAITRQIGHYAYHVGQIVYLARQYAGSGWTSLSIPRGESEAYARRLHRGYR